MKLAPKASFPSSILSCDWETSQPGNVLRVFERGGHKKAEIGNPNREEDPGKPDEKLSDRGFGTGLRTDPVFLGLQKTRLLDPILSLPGPTIIPATIAAAVALRAMSSMLTTAILHTPAPTRNSGIPASALLPIRRFRKTSPAIPSNMSLRAQSRRASA